MTHAKPIKLACLLAPGLMLGLSGCVAYDHTPVADSTWYQAGYTDGCRSAVEADKSFSNKQIKDEARFADDEGYRSGWQQGFLNCRKPDSSDREGAILGQDGEF